ncbi:MAG: MaoC/PaaZ C-terminal domain-containing protein [Porticoccaceae bacterium]
MTPIRYWQQLQVGERFSAGPVTVSKSEVIEFARDFDPQPYHLDAEAAEQSIFGGLCASGWQICALAMRLLSRALEVDNIPILGSPGVPSLRWKRPLFAGESVEAAIELVELREGPIDSPYSLANLAVNLTNQDGEPVLSMHCDLMIDDRQTPAENAHG